MADGGWKIIKRRHQGKGDSGETDLAGFLPKAGQSEKLPKVWDEEFDQISRVIRHQGWGDIC